MGRVRWLGRGATRVYVIANLLFLILIVVKGLSYPDPTASSLPWYLNLGFIAGIPAVRMDYAISIRSGFVASRRERISLTIRSFDGVTDPSS